MPLYFLHMYFSTISKVLQLLTFIHWPMDTLIEFYYDINKCWSFKGDPCKDFFLVFNIHNVDFPGFFFHSDFTWNQFGWFKKVEKYHFYNSEAQHFGFDKFQLWQNTKNAQDPRYWQNLILFSKEFSLWTIGSKLRRSLKRRLMRKLWLLFFFLLSI